MILDVCCGPMKIYSGFNKRLNDPIVSMDIRRGDFSVPKLKG